MKCKRIKWLDFTKGVLIFSVLIFHSILTGGKLVPITNNINANLNNNSNIITQLLNLFMMPGFFAISGFLYNPIRNIHGYMILIYKKFISIMLPGILFIFVGIASQNYHLLGKIFSHWYDLFICEYGDIWFLTTLFFIFITVGLLDLLHISLYIQIFLSVIFFLTRQYLAMRIPGPYIIKNVVSGTPITTMGSFLILFYLGYILKKLHIHAYIHNYLSIMLSIAISIVGAVIGLIIYQKIIISFFSVIIVIVCCMNFNQNNYMFKFFSKYGKFTLIIYLVHWPVVYFLIPKVLLYLNLTNSCVNNVWFLVPCKILVSGILSVMACYMANENKLVDFIFYPRKYISNLLLKTNLGKQFLIK